MDSTKEFLGRLVAGFEAAGCSCQEIFSPQRKIGFGVSGGADSMAMLYGAVLLRRTIFGDGGAEFVVVSINHNIRPKEESLADCLFVREFCKKLSKVEFVLMELEPGKAEETARLRGRGMEEAARFLRYRSFQSVIGDKGIDFFCLAHNQNDQLETLLLKFLQGSADGNAQGIPVVRERYLRPLLNISRKDIERFLSLEGVDFQRDKTNESNDYLRNRCRNILVPLLDKEFPGWNKAVLSGAKKKQADNDFIVSALPKGFWKPIGEGILCADWNSFCALHPALRRRVLFQGLNGFGLEQRIPFHLLEPLISWKEASPQGSVFSLGRAEVAVQKELIVIRRPAGQVAEEGFSLLVEKPGTYSVSGQEITIEAQGECSSSAGQEVWLNGEKFTAPIVIRNPQPGDKALFRGRVRSVQDVLKKRAEHQGRWAVVEEIGNPLVAIIVLS